MGGAFCPECIRMVYLLVENYWTAKDAPKETDLSEGMAREWMGPRNAYIITGGHRSTHKHTNTFIENNMDSQSDDAVKVAADAARDMTRLWRAWRTIHEMCQDRVCLLFFQ